MVPHGVAHCVGSAGGGGGVGGGGEGGGGVGGGPGGAGGAAGGGSGGKSALETATASGAMVIPRRLEMVLTTAAGVRLLVRAAAASVPPDSLTCRWMGMGLGVTEP